MNDTFFNLLVHKDYTFNYHFTHKNSRSFKSVQDALLYIEMCEENITFVGIGLDTNQENYMEIYYALKRKQHISRNTTLVLYGDNTQETFDDVHVKYVKDASHDTPLLIPRENKTISDHEIIGIGGYKEHGKNVVATAVCDYYNQQGVKAEQLDMSDTLREASYRLNAIIGFHPETGEPLRTQEALDSYGYTESKSMFPEYRRLLQALGTDVMRNMVSEDIWVDIVRKKINQMFADDVQKVVVTGIRFPNELAMCDTSIRVHRPKYFIDKQAVSENSLTLSDFDYIVINDKDKQSLNNNVHRFLEREF